MKKLVILFHRLGPYHITRLNSAAQHFDVTCIELSGITAEYQWDKVQDEGLFRRITLFKDEDSREAKPALLKQKVEEVLNTINPDYVAINGWWEKGALVALRWCKRNGTPIIVMSESTQHDSKRVVWKEYVKKRIVQLCDAALVGGQPHANYIQQLGMPATQIQTGYDVIDNQYFYSKSQVAEKEATRHRRELNLPENYILASNRFIEKKNLLRLLKGYHVYRNNIQHPFNLILLGDGIMRSEITATINDLSLTNYVHLPGFKQYEELPFYYTLARFFVHASTSEQWGLVVNEAMASGLPVVVSERCGCAVDLVENGKNGFKFNPFDEKAIGQSLVNMHQACLTDEGMMRRKSLEIVQEFSPTIFGKNLQNLAKNLDHAMRPMNVVDSAVLNYLIR